MITTSVLDPALSSRLCLMLVHSLWQVALLAAIAWCCERVLSWSVERRYLMHVAAMVIALVLLPVTFAVVDVGTLDEAAIARQVSVDEPPHVPLAPIEVAAPVLVDVEASATVSVPAKPQAVDDVELAGQQANSVAAVESPADASLWALIAPWLAAGYVAGVGLMLLRLMFGVWAAQRLVTRSRPVSDSAILVRLEQLTRRLSVRSQPVVAYSEQVLVPRIVGLLRPVILLPTSAMTGLAPEQVEMVLAHELTHLRRHDMWINLLQRVAEAVLFFNPLLWYLSHRINVLREYCCDDAVCRATTEGAEDVRCRYAAALLQVAELSRESAALGRPGRTPDAAELTTLAAAGRSPSQLRRRIARLVGEPIREPLHLSRGGLLTLLGVAVAVILSSSLWPVIAQTDQRHDKAEQRDETSDTVNPQEAGESRVEVIAIGTHNEKPQRWWDPSGKIIETPPFEWTAGHDVSGDDRQWRRVVIRVHDLAEGEEVRWEISGEPDSWGATVTVDGEKNPRGYYTRQFVVPKGQQDLGLRVGIASGEWKTVAAFGTHNTIEVKDAEPSFISAGTFEEEGGTTVFLTHDAFKPNFRVVAVDKEGQSHDSGYRGGLSTGTKIYQSRITFRGLSRDQIDHFKFQTRPYEWTEIDGLPLEPSGAESDVVDDTAAAQPDDAAVDLPIVVAEHVLLLNGREVMTWEELEQKIAGLPDPSLAYPRFYVTRGARKAGLDKPAKEQIWRLRKDYKLSGHSEGSLWPRSDLRYDRITSADDLTPDQSRRLDGRVVDVDGNAVEGAEVIVITPIDESISYRSYHIALMNGRVRNRLEHVMNVTDAEGRFTIYPPKDTSFTLVTLHPDGGFALTNPEALSRSEESVRLLQWASIAATFTDDEESQQADVSTRVEETDERPEVIFNQYWSDIAARDAAHSGTFRFTHVPPIFRTSVSRSFPDKEGVSFSVLDVSVSLLPGERRDLHLGPMSDQQRQRLQSIRQRFN